MATVPTIFRSLFNSSFPFPISVSLVRKRIFNVTKYKSQNYSQRLFCIYLPFAHYHPFQTNQVAPIRLRIVLNHVTFIQPMIQTGFASSPDTNTILRVENAKTSLIVLMLKSIVVEVSTGVRFSSKIQESFAKRIPRRLKVSYRIKTEQNLNLSIIYLNYSSLGCCR